LISGVRRRRSAISDSNDALPLGALEFGHLGRILARSPRFFRNVFSINTGLPDLASGPFCAEGVRPEGPRKHSPG